MLKIYHQQNLLLLHNSFAYFLGLIILLTFCEKGFAQNPFDTNSGRSQSGTGSDQSQIEYETPDTTILDYFTLGDKQEIHNFSDTLIDDQEKYLVSRTFDKAALTLGNSGSAAKRIMYVPRNDIYTDIGFHQYDIYKLSIDSLKFFKLNRTFNDLFFSPVSGSDNFVVKATFAREFAKNINLTLDLDRINQEGFYTDQATKITSFGVGLWQKQEDKSHEWYFTFLANNFNESHNGGIPYDLNTGDTAYDIDTTIDYSNPEYRRSRTAVPAFLTSGSGGSTRHEQFSYGLDNYFKSKSEKYNIHHRLQYEKGYYRYGDDNTSTLKDSLVYLDYLTETRGLRFINKFSRWTNQIDIGFDTKGFDLEVGAIYKYLSVDNSQEQSSYNDVAAFSKIGFDLQNIGQFKAKLQLGLGQNAGNIDLNARLKFTGLKGLDVQGFLKLLRYDPTLINEQMFVTNKLVYDNDFGKINEFLLGGQMSIKRLKLYLEFTSGLIDNPIYLNDSALPEQLDGSTEYIKGVLKHKFFWKFIGIENSVIYQSFSNNIYNIPKWHTLSNGFLQFRFFKKRLLGRVGILLYHYDFDGDNKFMPINGGFYPGENRATYYPYSELYGTFKVDRFFIFFKTENYTDALFGKVQYQIVDYPQFDAKFRMGIRWQIFD